MLFGMKTLDARKLPTEVQQPMTANDRWHLSCSQWAEQCRNFPRQFDIPYHFFDRG
jgi:hypothetical protein